MRQTEDSQPAAVSAIHREGLGPRTKLLRPSGVLGQGTLPFAGTIQSNMTVILHCPLACCASETCAADTGDDGGHKSHVALQEGRGGEGTQRSPLGRGVTGEGFSD